MEENINLLRGNKFNEKRRLNFLRIIEIVKEKKTIEMEKLISLIQFERGIAYKTAKEMVRVLFDTDQIVIDQDNIVKIGESK